MNFSGDPPFNFFPEPYLREFLLPGGRYYDPSIWSTEHRPGEYAMYANVGFDIISYLVEIISGEPFLEYCNTHIFSPLDMKHTGFNLSRLDINQVAIPYQRFKGKYYTINELGFMLGETPPEQYWRMRCYPASGLYTTVSDLSHFLIAHMNDGVYNGTRILKKETVELMHETQPGNQIGYGLAWEHESVRDISVTGHSGTFPGVYTEMLYNQTADIGVILLTNGDPAYGLLPHGGYYPVISILYLLFTKEGTLRGEMQHEFTVSSDPFFMTPLMKSRTMS
jgi:CubicO group peptidase (beta-lactamase class C family)